MNIGQRIKERRIELEMSMEQLANKLGINRSTVYRYETGEIEKMPIGVIKPIAEALNTTPAYLLGWDQDAIDAVSEIQSDADLHDDTAEHALKDFMIEIAENGFSSNDIKNIRRYAIAIKKTESGSNEELHKAFIELFVKLYDLGLNIDDLDELYTYAQFISSKKK